VIEPACSVLLNPLANWLKIAMGGGGDGWELAGVGLAL
jgi:hypothetical protein